MSRKSVVLWLASSVALTGCGVIASIAGVPKIVSVTINAPAGILLGESAVATAVAMGDDGRDHGGRPRTWRSSDPAAVSIDANGKMVGLIAGRKVTITAEVDGTTGSAAVSVASDDARFGYALADQPTVAGPYNPAAATRYNSGGGVIEVTRTGTGIYTVRFAGLGRTPGQHDNVQVSAYNTVPAYCKPDVWDASGVDLTVTVSCFTPNGAPLDSPFTVLALGAWALGKTAPLAFAMSVADTGTVILDSSATARNSTGGDVIVGHVAEGHFAMALKGLESAWAARPVGIQVSPVGLGGRRCRLIAIDATTAGLGIDCVTPGGALADASFSMLWLQGGRPTMRFGFAWADNLGATNDYSPNPGFRINSSGGAVTSRKTGAGQYRVVFAGLGRPAGGTETVLVSSFLFVDRVCDVTSWGNTGANDLFVTVACFQPNGAPADTQFSVLVIQ
jgi:hypothetical protein